jgi:hypothetical protein
MKEIRKGISREAYSWYAGKKDKVYFLRQSIVEVTELREGGDVRGSPLTEYMVLSRPCDGTEWTMWYAL